MVLSPAVSFAFLTADLMKCVKLVSGYDVAQAYLDQAVGLLNVAFAHPECQAQLMSEDPVFYSMLGTAIALKITTPINDKNKCQNLLNGMVDQAVGAAFTQNVANLTPEQQAQLKATANSEVKNGISSIPGMQYWSCACEYAYSGLLVSEIKGIVEKGAKALNACGSVTGVNKVLSGVGEGLGLSCPDEKKKIGENEYYQQFLAPVLDKYALATDKARHVGCYNVGTGACRDNCMIYYKSGSAGCSMEDGNANYLCDLIMTQFEAKVMARQPVLVAQALATCSPMGDGCVRNKDFPALVIDTYGQDTLDACLGVLKNTYKTPGCAPTQQPCCWRAPWPPALKCNKARAEAAARVGDLASQIGQDFNNLPPTFADAQMIAERKACQQAILGNTLKYVQDAACAAAAKTPTDDFSGIWPTVLKSVKGLAGGESYTKCDGPYNKRVRINGCKDKCAQPGTLQALYKRTDSSAATQCFDECMSGKIVGRTKYPAMEQSQSNQQANCLSQCVPLCDTVPKSQACIKCENACSSSTGSGSGGTKKQKVGSGGGVIQ
jgi:hypothetical protein